MHRCTRKKRRVWGARAPGCADFQRRFRSSADFQQLFLDVYVYEIPVICLSRGVSACLQEGRRGGDGRGGRGGRGGHSINYVCVYVMYVCMYVCMCLIMHACMYVCMYVIMYVCM